MNHLHAYWRIEYVAQEKEPAQRRPFSTLLAQTDDRASLILCREAHSFIIMNRYPYNAGHLLALPNREVPNLEDLSEAELLCLTKTTLKAKRLLSAAIKPDGFNIGMNLGEAAGAGIPKHLHQHIVPRWSGDTNFMPVLGNTRVLPQSLDAMYDHLARTLAEMPR